MTRQAPCTVFSLILFLAICRPSVAQESGLLEISGGRQTFDYPFELIDNRIFVDVEINGKGPFKFILDSGGINLLTDETADRLGLHREDQHRQGGAGAGTTDAWFTDVQSISVGRLRLSDQRCVVLSLEPIRSAIGFDRLDGLIGYEIFRRLVVGIDYEHHVLTFTQPSAFHYHGSGAVLPVTFSSNLAVISGTVEGFEGALVIDTGDRFSLTLFRPFVERHDLWHHWSPSVDITTGRGIGGPLPTRVVRIKNLGIDGFDVTGVVTRLPLLKKGAFTGTEFMGSLGTGVLKRFNIVFDYAGKRVIFEANGQFDAQEAWDGSGMWLSASDDGFVVEDVLKGGPADLAGIEKDMHILKIAGKPTGQLSLPDARTLLGADAAGQTVPIVVRTDKDTKDVELVLKRLI